jgi:DNA-binding GntR family transcriptional regulator
MVLSRKYFFFNECIFNRAALIRDNHYPLQLPLKCYMLIGVDTSARLAYKMLQYEEAFMRKTSGIPEHKSKVDSVYEILRNMISSGKWKNGEKKNAYALAKSLGVSRTPILEASRLLAMEGLLKIHPQVGLEVPEVTPSEVEEIFLIRGLVSGLATSRACRNLLPDDLENLKRIVERMDQYLDKKHYNRFVNVHREFHMYIYDRCGLPKLRMLAERYWNSGVRYFRFFHEVPGISLLASKFHHGTLKALQNRDESDARFMAETEAHQFGAALSKFLSENEHLLKKVKRPRPKRIPAEKRRSS